MDQSTRRKGGDSNYCESSKRKEKHKSSNRFMYHVPDWYHYQPVSEFSAGQWNAQGQRLYPTMSDSAVCGCNYSYDCTSLNPALPIYPVMSAGMPPVGLGHVRRPSRTRRRSNKYFDVDGTVNNHANFTSLPPVNVAGVGSSEKRRFSDPGLNNVDESNESSSNESLSDSCSFVNETLLLEQITELKSENKRLSAELQSTKDELNTLKSEFQVINNKVMCHEPISLAQMVKEIRDAAEVREKILLSKVENLVESCVNSKDMMNINADIESLRKRLYQLEHQLEHVRIHSKVDSKLNGEATTEELDNANKRKHDSNESIPKSQINAECNTIGEEESYSGLRLDLDMTNTESPSDCNGNSPSTVSYESLSSSLGPGSMSSATLTVCGPVTDL